MALQELGKSPARQYVDTVSEKLVAIGNNMDVIVAAAEQAAERLVKGGNLYAASDEEGFVSEACGRAGGMMMIRGIGDPSVLTKQDVVLIGTMNLKIDEQQETLRAMRKSGALLILFGSVQSPLKGQTDLFIDNFLPLGTVPIISIEGGKEKISPVAGVSNITAMWVFTGELVAACTRLGKMPTMYQSIGISSSVERNPRYQGRAFHDDMTILPVPARKSGEAFLADLTRCFKGIQDTQIPLYQEAGSLAAEALSKGNTVWSFAIGHHLPAQKGLPGDPGLMYLMFDGSELEEKAKGFKKDDVFVFVGYYTYPEMQLNVVRKTGVRSVWIQGGREAVKIEPLEGEIHIDAQWEYGDANVEIPGYDVKVLPPSGVMQTASLWMIVGEIAQAMG